MVIVNIFFVFVYNLTRDIWLTLITEGVKVLKKNKVEGVVLFWVRG